MNHKKNDLDRPLRREILVATMLVISSGLMSPVVAQQPTYWPQFRGPNASGIAAPNEDPPITLSLDEDLLWKTPVPQGHSSPCIWEKRLFLTGYDPEAKKLQVLCLDRSNGQIIWQHDVPAEAIERVHEISSPATGTPATDGERVYFYFGSVGLLCFDIDGQKIWEYRLPIPQTRFGSGTSPIVAGELVVLNRSAEDNPFLLAVDRRTGTEVWKQALGSVSVYGSMSCATPVIWQDQIVLHRTGEVAGYSLEKGERLWWFVVSGTGNSTPAIGNDALFVNAWNNFGEPDLRVDLPGFAELVEKYDADGDKRVSEDEFPGDLAMARRPEVSDDVPGAQFLIKPFFGGLDRNKDGHLTTLEWFAVRFMVTSMTSEHGLVAIRTGGKGNISQSNQLWKETRSVAEVPSPLFHDGRVYMVKDGGIVTCFDAETGKVIYRERLGGPGAYHSSPILAANRIYMASADGMITVFSAGDTPEVLATSNLDELIRSTPAVLDNCFYVRTQNRVYAFGRKE